MTEPQYLKFNLIRANKRIKSATMNKEGCIRFYNAPSGETRWEENRAYVCVKHRNIYTWKEISDISSAKFNNYKGFIGDELEEMYLMFRMMENSHNVTKRKLRRKNKHKEEMLVFMFNKMNIIQQATFFTEYPEMKQEFSKYKCNVCNKLSTKAFKNCRHDDCKKMCQDCHNNWNTGSPINNKGVFVFGHISTCKSQCPACNKSQDYQCPICYDEKPQDGMMFSDNCSHHICKNCFCNSFNSVPIVDCPMCRKQFRDSLGKTDYHDDDGASPGSPISV